MDVKTYMLSSSNPYDKHRNDFTLNSGLTVFSRVLLPRILFDFRFRRGVVGALARKVVVIVRVSRLVLISRPLLAGLGTLVPLRALIPFVPLGPSIFLALEAVAHAGRSLVGALARVIVVPIWHLRGEGWRWRRVGRGRTEWE